MHVAVNYRESLKKKKKNTSALTYPAFHNKASRLSNCLSNQFFFFLIPPHHKAAEGEEEGGPSAPCDSSSHMRKQPLQTGGEDSTAFCHHAHHLFFSFFLYCYCYFDISITIGVSWPSSTRGGGASAVEACREVRAEDKKNKKRKVQQKTENVS